ncbi:L,D-transpeptidase [Yinghuangia seranimata]|uniref:L,D-transpeptidase n=1 Tax=Yinghuangia seranimata TaxID=408067 RepID=UPI00248B5E78|nr:L,D-transpeptidase [Yinghuangia seranimata]MDI2124933.1 L,D-transpeptidase [Yinghuangia seranimata]
MRSAMRTVVHRSVRRVLTAATGAGSGDGNGNRGVRPSRHGLVSVSLAGALVAALAPAADAATPAEASPCPLGYVRIVCVDLTQQTLWTQDKDGNRTFGPVPIRSGRKAFPTRTGLKRIYAKKAHEYSSLYNVSMPYTQYFDRGQALHAYAGAITDPPGSHGCVNMRFSDAKKVFSLTRNGDYVFLWGSRP